MTGAVTINVDLSDVLYRLDRIDAAIAALTTQGEKIMAAIDDLKTAIAAEDTLLGQVESFLATIPAVTAAAVAAAIAGDDASAQAMVTDVTAQTATLQTALAAAQGAGTTSPTTPAAPAPAA